MLVYVSDSQSISVFSATTIKSTFNGFPIVGINLKCEVRGGVNIPMINDTLSKNIKFSPNLQKPFSFIWDYIL